MSYSVTVNATLGSLALDSSALSGFAVADLLGVQVGPSPSISPAAADEPVLAPQIQKIRTRKSQEEDRKQKLLAKLPSRWVRDQNPAAELPPPELAGPEPAAIYRRVSTPEQKDSSMDRQGGVENYARLINCYIAFVYDDKGKSGRFKAGRPDFMRMMKDAEAGKFKKLILEFGNRLSRDLGLTTSVFRDLRRWGVEIHTPAEGKWHLLHAAFNGVMSQEALENLKIWTRAGIERAVLDGKFPGTAPYGFEKRPGYPGELFEVDEKAKHVKWIYSMRSVGVPVAEIRRHLNAKGVKSPRGKKWSTVQVGAILRNPIYIGLLIYFKTKSENVEVDAYTIARKITKMPMSAWRVSERPDWEIVDVGVWNKIQTLDMGTTRKLRKRSAKRLLSEIVFCGHCGSAMHHHARAREHVHMHCSDFKRKEQEASSKPDTPPCPHRTSVYVQCVEIVTVQAVAERIAAVGALATAEKAYKTSVAKEIAEADADRKRLEAEMESVLDKIKGTFETAYTQNMPRRAIESLRKDYNDDLERKELELAALPVVTIPDRPLENVDFNELSTFLQDFPYCKNFDGTDERESRLVAALQELVHSVNVEALSSRSFNLTIRGPLAHIGALPDDPDPVIRIEARDVELKLARNLDEDRRRRWNRVSLPEIVIKDEEWTVMAPMLPTEPIWIEGYPKPIALRDVMDLLMFKKRANIGFGYLKDSCPNIVANWDHPLLVLRAASEIANFWNVIDLFIDVASNHAPRLLEGINIRLRGRRSVEIDDIPAAFDRRNSLKKARALNPKVKLSLPTRYSKDNLLT